MDRRKDARSESIDLPQGLYYDARSFYCRVQTARMESTSLMRTVFRQMWEYRHLMLSMAMVIVRARYRRTALGMLWSLLGPVALVLSIGAVYGQIIGRPFSTFVPFLFGGLFSYRFITSVAGGGCTAFINAQGYVKQIAVPLVVYPGRLVLANFIDFLLSFGSLSMLLFVIQVFHPSSLITALPGLVILLVFGLGLGLFQAIVGTIFRDYQHITSIFFQLMFYVTPILYPPEIMDNFGRSWIYLYNPLYYVITCIRQPFLTGQFPPVQTLGIAAAVALIALGLGTYVLGRVGRSVVMHL